LKQSKERHSIEELGDFYEEYKSSFITYKKTIEHSACQIASFCENRDWKVLDVGIGGGGIAALLKQYNLNNIEGCDNFSGNVEKNENKYYWGWGDITTIISRMASIGVLVKRINTIKPNGGVPPVEKLPFAKESFDMVFNCHVIEHITDMYTFLTENSRILKKGGLLYIKTPNSIFLKHRLKLLLGINPYVKLKCVFNDSLRNTFYGCHIRELTMKEISFLVEKIGLEIIKRDYVSYSQKMKLISRIYPPFAEELVIVAKKR
jgi:ubiquinone/menaquinone biosynthesis C-methylase UbiE